MASSEADSRLNSVIITALEKIIKNASWRKHSKLAHECKVLIERLSSSTPPTPTSPDSSDSIPGPVHDGSHQHSLAESEIILNPLIAASSSGFAKLADPALDCIQKLIAHACIRGEADIDGGPDSKLLSRLIESICSCRGLGDEALELLVIKTLLSAVTSTSLRIHGDTLLQIVRTSYDIYLESRSAVNQTTAKASLIQMLVIIFRRMEADSSTVPVQPIVVAELMEPADRSGTDANTTQFVQGFITKIIQDIDVVLNPSTPSARASMGAHDGAFETTTVETTNPADLLDSTDKDMLDAKYWEISMYKTALEGRKVELVDGDMDRDDDMEVQIGNKLRRDAFLVFRALCKLSMKTPPKEALTDPSLMRGKIVALELLKILLENAGAMFRTSERFLGAIKQYLCLSLLKNSASTFMIVFQLSCSIFISLVSRFRAGLKAEIGVFFPMIVLRVLENVAQPNFQQKMIVLRFLDKLCMDSQILVDIFINYDCDVHSSNIFERMVNGLLKTVQGVPPGTTTTLLPQQEATMKLKAMKCLVAILRSMGDWMNKQLHIPVLHSPRRSEAADNISELNNDHSIVSEDQYDTHEVEDFHLEATNEASEVASLQQRRAYKLELQEGISLFNQKPKKGIHFLICANKVGNSPEEIAVFLKEEPGLNKSAVGDYLGEKEQQPLEVMHAYIDLFDFQGMELDEALRALLRAFRLPGEAQKIDRIMLKFAHRYCRCNPKAFAIADTAYALAYSVIMLNTDAHNPMVKIKMTVEDFIKINHEVIDGKDISDEYIRSLYDRITKNEIKLNEEDFSPPHKYLESSNRLLGLDNILNIVIRRDYRPIETSDDLIRRMQEQFKEKARKSESVYYAAADVSVLRFMIEVCWAPMLAAFSVPLDQSEDEQVISQCLEGFCTAVHVTAVMSMKTHRDAFVTSLAKFTSLHSAADIKQKNIDAIKAILAIARVDGNYLREAWEHVLTCVSRFEHLHLLGEGAPPDATFFALNQNDFEKAKESKSAILPVLKKKGPGRIQYVASAARRGSYDSAGVGGHASGVVTSELMSNLVSNLNMLEQVSSSETNRIFTRSQKLNSEAIIDFVKALCKVSMEELRSTSDPRVFSLTKIVEIAHYNMNRIRLVWSSIWHVLSEFFVAIGCSENLSIAIFAMDSLRQLAMKFLEREELANYNFQNEFMRPFVVVMRKSSAVEIRELIVRCISQMILARVSHVKSGWKSMFMVFTTAAYDDQKNIVLLAFAIIEKIVRDYFPYITETETTTFTDCVNCLIAFTNSKFNKDVSLNAIGFLRFCAMKLAEGDLGSKKEGSQHQDKEDHLYFWFPLLAGLSELTFDPRPEIRKSALQVLFETLRTYGNLFTFPLWEKVFDSVLFPIFDYVRHALDPSPGSMPVQGSEAHECDDQDAWLYETCTLALQLVVDLFVKFYDPVHLLLVKILNLLVSFVKRPHQSLAGIGIAAFVRLIADAGDLYSEDKWLQVVLCLKETASATLPDFLSIMIEVKDENVDSNYQRYKEDNLVGLANSHNNIDGMNNPFVHSAIVDAKCRAAVQLLLIQAMMEIYNMYQSNLSMRNVIILFEALHNIAVHAHRVNSSTDLRSKLQELSSTTQMQDPPLLRLENESYQFCFTLLQNILLDSGSIFEKEQTEFHLVELCQEVLQFYLNIAQSNSVTIIRQKSHWFIPLGSAKRRELVARSPLVVGALHAFCTLGHSSFAKNLSLFFPLLVGLICCEHGSAEIQSALSSMLNGSVGPILLRHSSSELTSC